ncbi:MAG: hypothetical protein QXO20_06295 [Candidatus Bathyarchaeia archaeon]
MDDGHRVLKMMATCAGVNEEQFLKVAGVLYLAEKGLMKFQEAWPLKSDLEKRIMHLLSIERALSTRDLEDLLREPREEVESAVQKLEADGKVISAMTSPNVRIVALVNDGTLDITSLPPEERRWMIVNAYGNRDKGMTYAQLYSFLKSPKHAKGPVRPSKRMGRRKEEVLQALKEGPKRLSELIKTLNLPEGTAYWVLAALIREGRVERIGKGLYKLASAPAPSQSNLESSEASSG